MIKHRAGRGIQATKSAEILWGVVFETRIRESFLPAFWDVIKFSAFSAMHRALGGESSFLTIVPASNLLFEKSLVILCSPVRGKSLTVTYYWFVFPQLDKAVGSSGRMARKSCQGINEEVLPFSPPSPPQGTEDFHRESCPGSFIQTLIPNGEATVANLSEKENIERHHLDLSRSVWLKGRIERLFADWERGKKKKNRNRNLSFGNCAIARLFKCNVRMLINNINKHWLIFENLYLTCN